MSKNIIKPILILSFLLLLVWYFYPVVTCRGIYTTGSPDYGGNLSIVVDDMVTVGSLPPMYYKVKPLRRLLVIVDSEKSTEGEILIPAKLRWNAVVIFTPNGWVRAEKERSEPGKTGAALAK